MSDDHSDRLFNTNVVRVDFQGWPKTPRLFKDMTVTEKLDGTNAAVIIARTEDEDSLWDRRHPLFNGEHYLVGAQSRNRLITPDSDNFGFATWVHQNRQMLVEALGVGRHFGEWWGLGIQRGYGKSGRTFSLFNTAVYGDARDLFESETGGELSVVPELYAGPFDTGVVRWYLDEMEVTGSVAAPGFTNPEGVCVFHHASRQVFKATFENDGPKGSPRDNHGNVLAFPVAA